MPENDYLPFATGPGANVINQASFATDPSTAAGFSAGIAQSQKCNKVWRQSSVVSAAIASFISETLNINMLDDGNISNFVENLEAAIIALAPRQAITANTTYYVNPTTGSDSYDGLTPTTAKQTINAAIEQVYDIDFNGHNITIQLANGTYPGGNILVGVPVGQFRPRNLFIQGNTANPMTVQIIGTDTWGFRVADGAMCEIQGVHISTTTSGPPAHACLEAVNGSILFYQYCDFGPGGWGHVLAVANSEIFAVGPYTISGGGAFHFDCNNAYIRAGFTPTGPFGVTITGAPTFTYAFLSCENFGECIIDNIAWSGTAHGTTHHVHDLAVLSSYADLPGDVTGNPSANAVLSASAGYWRLVGSNVPPGGYVGPIPDPDLTINAARLRANGLVRAGGLVRANGLVRAVRRQQMLQRAAQ